MTTLQKSRIQSIDIVRGIAMVVMALDHVRDFFHVTANTDDPLNLETTTPALFFTRFATHFCAPIFVFLSGSSIYLQSLRKSKKELSIFLMKRGLWLIFVELTVIALAWTFDPLFHIIPLGVIWAIGISMFLLGLIIYLPYKYILILGLIIVCGHNLLDIPESAPDFQPGFWWDLFHSGHFTIYFLGPERVLLMVYPFVAWTGLMMLGYCAGIWFTDKFTPQRRQKILVSLGLTLLAVFVLLRYINSYGDPQLWKSQDRGFYTFLSFLDVEKYPPSLLYLCITVGVTLLLLALFENINNWFTRVMLVYGRTAFFYYIIHLYVIHLTATILFFAKGTHTVQDAFEAMRQMPFLFVIPGVGVGLALTYVIWIVLVILLYPLCKWYDRYKRNHKEKWWLSYL